ncbi:sulfatase-like hydrolase/transferase [Archaeoglobus neptunius]|uniref:sulfatase-like hydrolase/transferase n=1 Tax=Archaeoglobus neptunius TaxID=2798580 RepID=UPI00192587B5|nr:sulfatase-like hydrolase/transferase [Archaeoglobus neptunius]
MGDRPNIIWIVLDTLRDDYSGPIWDVLKKYGFVRYENVIAPAPWTIPSHVSMFTGMYPSEHGVHEPFFAYQEPIEFKIYPCKIQKINKKTIFKTLSGYKMVLVSANQWISPEMGFNFFNEYYNILPIGKVFCQRLKFNVISKGTTHLYRKFFVRFKKWPLNKGVDEYLKASVRVFKDINEPIFMFVNLMETHEPYRGVDFATLRLRVLKQNTKIPSKLAIKLQNEYQNEIMYLIPRLEKTLKWLVDKGLILKSIVIITSDHGQLLGEHNQIGHGVFLHDELIKVPLYVRVPKDGRFERDSSSYCWISLKDVFYTLKAFINSNVWKFQYSYGPVYSEVFSPGYVGKVNTEEERRNIEHLEKHRIAVYHGPYKGIYNVRDGVLEYVKSYDPEIEIAEDVKELLIRDVKKYLKQVKLKSTVRKISSKL